MECIMLRELEKAEQKWGGSNKLIDQWLKNRRKLLVHYCQIAGLPPYGKSEKSLPSFEHVKSFCDLLVDYVSEGHFEVYDRVVNACSEYGESSKTLAQQVLPKITPTTNAALDFNDKYAETQDDLVLYQLDKDLSELAHNMETRFELEDELLEVLHRKHSEHTQ
ncbi:anti-sigma factor [Shewanella baltica]|jgi:regulator of sigma D|uniref:Regulator of RpoD, Rsd/AlgQ n=3 Tax=Shewanellaceae TaxID=267890 RepID=A9L5B0_SHEB9|nr:regulator of RpoD, Rsd/AlgQ [Shewanella baltica OS155]ABS10046.1 regulator of RpoD, Rsd/AlgQ [Shewanella baltica OS185]ABX51204.1 regulator of RpoD, Rsd/AlgQ [Shewanella baltica OS195]KZK66346.1 anti-sigma factor [Shewanella baltica]OUS49797.1 Rsd/AlgQ family anti-sigma factor [Shewanella sp. SACH]